MMVASDSPLADAIDNEDGVRSYAATLQSGSSAPLPLSTQFLQFLKKVVLIE